MANELKRFIKAYRYEDWIEHVTDDFEYRNFMKGLEWFSNSKCKGCLEGGGMPACEVRNCCEQKGLKNCYFCNEFSKCERLAYQKQTYRIGESYRRTKQVGYENWLKGQEKKTRRDFDNIYFLETKT